MCVSADKSHHEASASLHCCIRHSLRSKRIHIARNIAHREADAIFIASNRSTAKLHRTALLPYGITAKQVNTCIAALSTHRVANTPDIAAKSLGFAAKLTHIAVNQLASLQN